MGEFFGFLFGQWGLVEVGDSGDGVEGGVDNGVDAVAQQAGVFGGPDVEVVVVVEVAQVLVGHVQQFCRGPADAAGGVDGGHQGGPGRVGGDGFGQGAAEYLVEVWDPVGAQVAVGGFQGGRMRQAAGDPPPQCGGRQFVGKYAVFGHHVIDDCGDVAAGPRDGVEVFGELWPEGVLGDSAVVFFHHGCPAGCLDAWAPEDVACPRLELVLDVAGTQEGALGPGEA
ncbi:Uncharacterised protein [Mycobacteroides abscessus subsp. abscessus]|nr:Uncharacterised protein [Mycobacteroides abscessus subsp. abscessus]SKW97022.1 Uncharacterised protein [Mycobacteroides abscessus subsp. abscessus]